MEKNNVVSPVLDAQVSFKKPVRYGDNVFVETWIEKYDGLRTVYGYQIIDEEGEIRVTGTTKHVIVKKDNFRPISLKKAFPKWHVRYMQSIEGEQ